MGDENEIIKLEKELSTIKNINVKKMIFKN